MSFQIQKKRCRSSVCDFAVISKNIVKSGIFSPYPLTSILRTQRGSIARYWCQIIRQSSENQSVRSREFIKCFFDLKIAIFTTALVLGNRSMRLFLLYKQPHIFPNRLKTSLWGNMSENLWFPIASTLLLPKPDIQCSLFSPMSGFSILNVRFFYSAGGRNPPLPHVSSIKTLSLIQAEKAFSGTQVLKRAWNKGLSRFRCGLQQSFGSPFSVYSIVADRFYGL